MRRAISSSSTGLHVGGLLRLDEPARSRFRVEKNSTTLSVLSGPYAGADHQHKCPPTIKHGVGRADSAVLGGHTLRYCSTSSCQFFVVSVPGFLPACLTHRRLENCGLIPMQVVGHKAAQARWKGLTW
jgi:hypothetical protein